MTKALNITYHGVPLTVVGTFAPYRPATYWQPAEGGEFEIDEVLHHDEDISDLLDLDDLEAFCLNGIYEAREAAREEAAADYYKEKEHV